MKRIIFVSHCALNTAAKVEMYDEKEIAEEEALRLRFIGAALESGVQLVQLPCPEFTLYGAKRWGHVSEQFDNPFFRAHCRRILEPVLEQLEEYLANPDCFEVLGIAGIDGSPSCGVDYTCTGPWKGNLGGRDDLAEVVSGAALCKGRGVLFDELQKLLKSRNITLPVVGLFAPEPEKVMGLLKP